MSDGRQDERTFEVMSNEGAFPRLVELVKISQDSGAGLHRMLMQLLYEMSRIQRIRHQELGRDPISRLDFCPALHN